MGCDPLPSLVDEYYTTSQRLLSIIFLENNSQCPKLMRTDGNQTNVLQKYDWFFRIQLWHECEGSKPIRNLQPAATFAMI